MVTLFARERCPRIGLGHKKIKNVLNEMDGFYFEDVEKDWKGS